MIVLQVIPQRKTIAFLNKSKINEVKSEEWMPKSSDAAPMDYSIWGYLKQQLNKQKIGTLDELFNKILYQWKKIDQIDIDKVLSNWPKMKEAIGLRVLSCRSPMSLVCF